MFEPDPTRYALEHGNKEAKVRTRLKVNLGEFTFEQQCIADKLPPFEREYRFDMERRFRFDFAWPDLKVAVEIDGGIFNGGAHSNPLNILRDMTKNNLAVANGWKVLRYTPSDVKCGLAIAGVKALIEGMACSA